MADKAKEAAKPQQNKEKVHRFKNLKAEFKKVIWPDKKTALKQTGAVVAVSVFLGVLIGIMDAIIKFGLNFIL